MSDRIASLTVGMDVETATYMSNMDRLIAVNEKLEKQLEHLGELGKQALELVGIEEAVRHVAELGAHAAEAADHVGKLSQEIGIGTEQLSQLSVAAELADQSTDAFGKGMARLAKVATEAAAGGKKQAAIFRELGVEVKDADGHVRPMADLLGDIADKFQSYEGGAEKAALAQALFGKAGLAMIPTLNKGREGFEEAAKFADEYGLTIGPRFAKRSEEFDENLKKIHLTTTGLANVTMEALIPALLSLSGQYLSTKEKGDALKQTGKAIADVLTDIADAALTAAGALHMAGTGLAKILEAGADLFAGKAAFGGKGPKSLYGANRSKGQSSLEDETKRDLEQRQDEDDNAFNARIKAAKEDLRKARSTAEQLDKINEQIADVFAGAGFGAPTRKAPKVPGGGGKKHRGHAVAHGVDHQKLYEHEQDEDRKIREAQEDEDRKIADEADKQAMERNRFLSKSDEDVADDHFKRRSAIIEANLTPLEKYNRAANELNRMIHEYPEDSDKFIRALDKENKAYTESVNQLSATSQKLADGVTGVLVDQMENRFKDGFAGIAKAFEKMLEQMAIQAASSAFVTKLFQGLGIAQLGVPAIAGATTTATASDFATGAVDAGLVAITAPSHPGNVIPSASPQSAALTSAPIVRHIHDHRFDDRTLDLTFRERLEQEYANTKATQ